jgi:hypothetical protein
MSKSCSWLSRSQQDALDTKLFGYKSVDRLIATRKVEIETISNHSSEIGRVQSSVIQNIPEQLTIKYSEDIVLQNLYLFRSTVEECYSKLSPELQLIFTTRWIVGGKTWPEIEHDFGYSEKSIYRKRTVILEKYAELSGMARY